MMRRTLARVKRLGPSIRETFEEIETKMKVFAYDNNVDKKLVRTLLNKTKRSAQKLPRWLVKSHRK